jgi:hypothetical protein
LGFRYYEFKKLSFLFKAALISIEIAERSIFNFPDIVSMITEVSASSTTLPWKPLFVIILSPTFRLLSNSFSFFALFAVV